VAKPKAPEYEPATIYMVKLSRKIERGAMIYRPLNEYEMKGAFIQKLTAEHGEDCIDSAKPR